MTDTNPETEVSPEDAIAAAFEKQAEMRKASRDEEPEEEPEDEPPKRAKAEEEAPEEEKDEGEEIEVDGEKYVVPPKLKDAFLKNKDYTEKTQRVAEQRKELEEQKQLLQQAEQLGNAKFSKAVEIGALDREIKRYQDIDWLTLANSDPAQAVKLDIALRGLQTQRTKAEREMQEVVTFEQQATAKQRQQMQERGYAELSRDIKGWGPELSKQIAETGRALGYSEKELEAVTPRDVKTLHKAYLWDQLQKSKVETTKRVADTKPVTVKSARTTQDTQNSSTLKDSLARARKTGRTDDVEDAITRLFESKRKR